MKKEIGGYLELEQFAGEEYHQDMIKLNLGRTALLYALKSVGTKVLWVPYFLCDSVTKACEMAGYTLKYYHIDENFLPVLTEKLPYGEFIYIVNYYGVLDDLTILKLREKHTRVILDNTHAFYQKPLPFMQTIYSLRKYFGLADGAYLSMGGVRSAIPLEMLEQDRSCGRMNHVLGRYEEEASSHYQEMLDNAHGFEGEMVMRMSALTENLLRGIDYDRARVRREANYRRLEELLGEKNTLKIAMPEGPFAYPFHCENGIAVRRKLAEKKIYVPTYWRNVIENCPEDSLEWDLAANVLPLPCDQRYEPEDMEQIAEALREVL